MCAVERGQRLLRGGRRDYRPGSCSSAASCSRSAAAARARCEMASFSRGLHLPHRARLALRHERRVVAEPAAAARPLGHVAAQLATRMQLVAFRGDRHQLGHVGHGAVVPAGQCRQQRVQVLGIGRVLAGEAGRPHAGPAVQRRGRDPGVVGQHPGRAADRGVHVAGLQLGVVTKGDTGLLGQVARVGLDLEAGKQPLELPRLVRVMRRQHELHGAPASAVPRSPRSRRRPGSAAHPARRGQRACARPSPAPRSSGRCPR